MNTSATEVETRLVVGRQRAHSAHHVQPQLSRLRHGMSPLIGGLAAFWMAASPLNAGELSAMAGESVDLGRFHGVVYFTSEDDLHRVVLTIADGEAGLPLRFTATLAEGQLATMTVPGGLGEPGHRIEISRSGDKLVLTEGAASPEM